MRIICLTPVYNDWASLSTLIKELKNSAHNNNWNLISIIAVNDCSSDNYSEFNYNRGDQRNIAIGCKRHNRKNF